ncbi:MAG: glycosyltransferase [Bryobacteraceae bacterium]
MPHIFEIPDPFGPEVGMRRPIARLPEGPCRSLTLLIAGVLCARKGIREVVRALVYGPDEVRQRVILVVIGEMDRRDSGYVSENLRQLEESGGNVVDDIRLITANGLDAYIQRSDAVLTGCCGLKESSEILIRAAHLGRPVISTHEGLVGYLVRKHGLGEALDVGDPQAFAACIQRFLSNGRLSAFDPAAARQFADRSNPELVGHNLFLLRPDRAIAG